MSYLRSKGLDCWTQSMSNAGHRQLCSLENLAYPDTTESVIYLYF